MTAKISNRKEKNTRKLNERDLERAKDSARMLQEKELTEDEAIIRDDLRRTIADEADLNPDSDQLADMIHQYVEEYGEDHFLFDVMFQLYEMHGDIDAMEDLLGQYPEEAFDPLFLRTYQARIDFDRDDFQSALAHLEQIAALPDDPASLYVLQLKAMAAAGCQKYSLAASCMEDLLLDGENTDTLVMAGAFCEMDGQIDRAREYYAKGFQDFDEADAGWAAFTFNKLRMNSLFDSELIPEQAKSMMKASIAGNITPEEIIDALTDADKKGDYSKALELGQKMYEMDPENTSARFMLAESLHYLGRKEEAEEHYQYVLNKPVSDTANKVLQTTLVIMKISAIDHCCQSERETIDGLKKILNETGVNHPGIVPILEFAMDTELMGFLSYVFKQPGIYKPANPAEKLILDEARIKADLMNGNFDSALKLCRSICDKNVRPAFYLDYAEALMECRKDPIKALSREKNIPDFYRMLMKGTIYVYQGRFKAARQLAEKQLPEVRNEEEKELLEMFIHSMKISGAWDADNGLSIAAAQENQTALWQLFLDSFADEHFEDSFDDEYIEDIFLNEFIGDDGEDLDDLSGYSEFANDDFGLKFKTIDAGYEDVDELRRRLADSDPEVGEILDSILGMISKAADTPELPENRSRETKQKQSKKRARGKNRKK